MLCQFGDVPKLDEGQRETDQCPLWVTSRHSNPTFTNGSFGVFSGHRSEPNLNAQQPMSGLINSNGMDSSSPYRHRDVPD